MWKFLGKTVASMVLTKEAREVAGGLAKTAVRHAAHKVTGVAPAFPETDAADQQALAPLQDPAAIAAANRAELIRRAMEVRAAKQTVLAELNEEDRARLVATAMRAFLAEGKPKE